MASRGSMSRSRELALLIAGSACLVLAFPPFSAYPLAFVALVPFFHVIGRTGRDGLWNGFRPGFVAGLAFFIPLLYWLIFLSSDQMNNPVVMTGPLVLLVLLQSLFWGLFSACASIVGRRTLLPAAVAFPVLWVAFEHLRSLGVTGFTWGALGYAVVPAPIAIQFASFTGLFGVSFWIALVNVLVLAVLTSRRRGAAAVALLFVLALPLGHGALMLRSGGPAAGNGEAARTMRVAVIQPNISARTKWDPEFKSVSFDVLERLTAEAAAHEPDLIVWPETAAPSYLLLEPTDLERVKEAARAAGAPILTGCPGLVAPESGDGPRRPVNMAVLIDEQGQLAGTYSKMKLVPFGEVIPFETVVPFLRNVDFGEADFIPGTDFTVFSTKAGSFSALVCYESAFPRLVRRFVADGADVLVNITNDVWYGRTSMPYQHASMAVMRTVENRRSLARSANSGVSMLVDPYGRVLAGSGIFEEGYLVGDLPMPEGTTFYATRGDVFSWTVLAIAGLIVALAVLHPRRGAPGIV